VVIGFRHSDGVSIPVAHHDFEGMANFAHVAKWVFALARRAAAWMQPGIMPWFFWL
jgi:hypothetical protein